MLPDRVSNPGPLTYESGALPIALRGPAHGFTEILTKKFHYSKYGKQENWSDAGKNKHEKAGSQSHNTIHHYHLPYKT